MQAAIKELQETAIVMSGIQARQAAALKDQAEWLAGHEQRMLEQKQRMRDHEQRMERIGMNLSEATDKLNALIKIVDDRRQSS